jgi:hypothetical protein
MHEIARRRKFAQKSVREMGFGASLRNGRNRHNGKLADTGIAMCLP